MIRFMSDTNTPSDIKNGRMRLQVSVATRLDTPSDAEIRNKVEGYRTEAEVIAEAALSFCEQQVDPGQWQAYRAGWLSMARERGQLPSLGAACP